MNTPPGDANMANRVEEFMGMEVSEGMFVGVQCTHITCRSLFEETFLSLAESFSKKFKFYFNFAQLTWNTFVSFNLFSFAKCEKEKLKIKNLFCSHMETSDFQSLSLTPFVFVLFALFIEMRGSQNFQRRRLIYENSLSQINSFSFFFGLFFHIETIVFSAIKRYF